MGDTKKEVVLWDLDREELLKRIYKRYSFNLKVLLPDVEAFQFFKNFIDSRLPGLDIKWALPETLMFPIEAVVETSVDYNRRAEDRDLYGSTHEKIGANKYPRPTENRYDDDFYYISDISFSSIITTPKIIPESGSGVDVYKAKLEEALL